MQPILQVLEPDMVQRILDEAFQLLQEPGVRVQSPEAVHLLEAAGAAADATREAVRIPEAVVRGALQTVPRGFVLYTRDGEPAVRYGGDAVQFDPGSSGVNVLDPESGQHRPAVTADLVRLIQVAEMLPAYDAQSTAVVCSDVPQAIGDLYRLFLVLLHSNKPIVTGAFSIATLPPMLEILSIYRHGREELARQPLAVFDVCPTPPLVWSRFAAQNLVDLARAGVPAQMVSMPLAGVGAPVTLLGSVVQHAAESLSGLVLHQLAAPGAPIVWGGAPAIFDMRHGTTPMGAIETAMIDIAYAQVGKSLGLPTHAYLGASDAKLIDAQAGMESGISAVLGALGGINMISGAGMLDFLACQSAEKLVVDAEAIGMAKRLAAGVEARTETLATEMFAGIDFKPDFLKQKATRRLFSAEQYLPSSVIDRASARAWQEAGRPDTTARARARTEELLKGYQRPRASSEQEAELQELVARLAKEAGMDSLPPLGDG
jgi:trimethylamine--corrinoid protein Co-methyltransferase